ncbi:APC family permease [Paenarthrobacter sp. RAF54_2]|uniref:APC family permease n=1 Tax=Paenarthrobacter sp. RAF54_2 TaxID=3233061 RepID=UPI003F988AAE
MSAKSLTLTVLAFSAPMAVVTGFIPFTILFGGQGATFAFVLVTILLLVFSVGYIAMTKHLPKPGAFYSFISAGLGKAAGLGSAYLAIVSYVAVLVGSYAFLGLCSSGLITSLNGPDTPWWVWSLAGWAVVSSLGYFHIELSAKILSIAMVGEVLLVMIFNVFVLAKGGAEGLSPTPFTPGALMEGDIPVTMLFCILVFMGFEATALFRDEVRSPDKTIPRATYGAVLFVGVLYIISAYALTSAYGSNAQEIATNAPATMFPDAIGAFVAPMFTQIAFIFVITSLIAALISIHNVVARYVYNLGFDKALPVYLSKIHPRHHSPHRASSAVAAAAGLLILVLILGQSDSAKVYGQLSGLGSIGVIFLMASVSLSVIAWFRTKARLTGENAFKVVIAPLISFLVLGFTVVFALMHFELIVGGAPGENIGLVFVLAGSFIAGIGVTIYFRFAKPHLYAGLGHDDEGDNAMPNEVGETQHLLSMTTTGVDE